MNLESRDALRAAYENKRRRVLELMRRHGARRLILTSPGATSWYLDGARTHVNLMAPPILSVVVSEVGDEVHIAANEVDRVCEEEGIEELPLRVVSVPWHQNVIASHLEEDTLHEHDVERELRYARASLLPHECARYARFGADIAQVFTRVLSECEPGDSEWCVASRLVAGVAEVEGDAAVLLVGGASRLQHRHPLPTRAPIGDRSLAVIGARRQGLMISATRWVSFRELTTQELERQQLLREVEHAFLRASAPGRGLRQAFAEGVAAYAENGFDADEWTRHHQGGPTGYFGRDPKASTQFDDLIVDHQAFAWNPTVAGDKVEDTVLMVGGAAQVLSHDAQWPSSLHRGILRPDTLVRI